MIRLRCPDCGTRYRVGALPEGKIAKCPKCGGKLTASPADARSGRSTPAARPKDSNPEAAMAELRSALAQQDGEGAKAKPRPSSAGRAEGSGREPGCDDVPMAKPVSRRGRMVACLGAGAALLIAVGIGVAVFWPAPYDLEELESVVRRARGLVEEALGPNPGPVKTLDRKALLGAHGKLLQAVAVFALMQRQLAGISDYEEDDHQLRDLREAVDSRFSIAEALFADVSDELWPGPGNVGDMFRRVSSSVPLVVVRGRGRTGSGFLVEHKRRAYVVTNRHVVERGNQGFVLRFLARQRGGHHEPVEFHVEPSDVVFIDLHVDLAVIRLGNHLFQLKNNWGIRPLELAKTKAGGGVIEVHDEIWVVGHPGAGRHGTIHTLDQGRVTGVTEPTTGDFTLVRFTAGINKGNSGGPVFNDEGRVVGIAFAGLRRMRQMNLGVHVNKLHELLAENDWPRSFSPHDIAVILDPEKQLGEDHEIEAHKLCAQGYRRCEWTGVSTEEYLELAPLATRQFRATKGNTYQLLVTSPAFHGEIAVGILAHKKLVYAKATGLGEVGTGDDGLSYRSGFKAVASGPHHVELVGRPRQPGEPIPACVSVFELGPSPALTESEGAP